MWSKLCPKNSCVYYINTSHHVKASKSETVQERLIIIDIHGTKMCFSFFLLFFFFIWGLDATKKPGDLYTESGQTLEGSFSAVSRPPIARVGAFFTVFRDLQDCHSFAPLRIQNFSKNVPKFFHNFTDFLQNFAKFLSKIGQISTKFHQNFTEFAVSSVKSRNLLRSPEISLDLLRSPEISQIGTSSAQICPRSMCLLFSARNCARP